MQVRNLKFRFEAQTKNEMKAKFKQKAQPFATAFRSCLFSYREQYNKRNAAEIRSDFNIAVAGARTGDFKIAVALTELVDKLFFFPRITQGDLVSELKQTAHVGGLNTNELMAGSVSAENIIENLIIVETFGNDNFEVALCGTRFAEIDACKRNVNQKNEHGKDDRNCNITHTCCKADSHCEEDACYFTRGSGGGTEADKAESTCNSNACAELSVNKGDNRLNYHRQKHKGDRKAFGGTISVSAANGDENAQCKRNKQANNKPACGQGACGGENTVDNVVKHSEKSFRLWMKTLGTERYRIVQPQYAAPRF